MEQAKITSDLEAQTQELLVQQVKSIERSNTRVHDCHLSIKKMPHGYKTILEGRYNNEPLKAQAEHKRLLSSFIKANKFFNSAIQSSRVKQEIQESFADYPVNF